MKRSQQFLLVLIVSVAAAAPPLTSRGFADDANATGDADAHLEQAATSVVAAAKESVLNASSDNQAAGRMQAAIEALRMIGMMGDIDTKPQTEELLNDLRATGRPAIVTAIIKVRLAQGLQSWQHLDSDARTQLIDQVVSDIKQAGLTVETADLFMRLSDMLERSGEYELAAQAINELLPAYREAKEPQIHRRTPLLEGVVRRLPGNKLELDGTLLDGGDLDWESYRGKVVLVDFFASWCGPCRAEVPNILRNYEAYKDKGFTVVGVNMDSERAAAESYIKQAGFDFPTLFSDDPEATGWDHPMGRKYGVTGLPRVILVDQDGTIVSTMARGPNLPALLSELLGEPGTTNDQTSAAPEQDPNVEPASFEEAAEVAPAAP